MTPATLRAPPPPGVPRSQIWLTAPKWINATTVAAIGSTVRPETDFSKLTTGDAYPNHPVLFNVATGAMTSVPFNFRRRGRLHHDIEYNHRTRTFLAVLTYGTKIRQKVVTVDALVEVWQCAHWAPVPPPPPPPSLLLCRCGAGAPTTPNACTIPPRAIPLHTPSHCTRHPTAQVPFWHHLGM